LKNTNNHLDAARAAGQDRTSAEARLSPNYRVQSLIELNKTITDL